MAIDDLALFTGNANPDLAGEVSAKGRNDSGWCFEDSPCAATAVGGIAACSSTASVAERVC